MGDTWFGINKFWLKGNLAVCIATDGREDFEKGLVVTEEMLEKKLISEESWPWRKECPEGGLELKNRLSISMMEGNEFEEYSDSEEDL